MDRPFVPDDFVAPASLSAPGFRLEPLGPAHNERDYEAWTSSMDHIRSTPGEWGTWPRPMSLEENLDDLEGHARDFVEKRGFTYSVLDGDDVIGCLYIYPDKSGETDSYVSSWVRESRGELDRVVWQTVTDWLSRDWPFGDFRYAPRP